MTHYPRKGKRSSGMFDTRFDHTSKKHCHPGPLGKETPETQEIVRAIWGLASGTPPSQVGLAPGPFLDGALRIAKRAQELGALVHANHPQQVDGQPRKP